MKRFLNYFLSFIIIVIVITLVLNLEVTTKQGINYQWYTKPLPLYLKILDFFDRHYNYKHLAALIVHGSKTDQERVIKIFEWTQRNIKKNPPELPVIDDHVWNIIIRGYGTDDQASDVFTTLCNYAGIDAFFNWIWSQDRTKRIPFSFVKIKYKWFIFDPYRGVYFSDKDGVLADIETIKKKEYLVVAIGERKREDMDYSLYFSAFPEIKEMGFTRSNTQSPFNRLLFEIKKMFK